MPPTLIGHTEKATTWGTGLEQINLGFLTYTLRTHLKEIEQALAMRCLRPGEPGRIYAEFNVEGLLRADSKGRAEFYRTMITCGGMTPNEVRRLENLPPISGGDNLFMQGAMRTVDALAAETAPSGAHAAGDETTTNGENPDDEAAAPRLAPPLTLVRS